MSCSGALGMTRPRNRGVKPLLQFRSVGGARVPGGDAGFGRSDGDDDVFRGRRVAHVGDAVDRDEDVGLGKLSRGAAPRDGVGRDHEAGRDALLAAEVAGEIDELALREAERGDVVGVEEDHAAAVKNSAVAIIEAVDRRVELIVRADRHHHEMTGRDIFARDAVRGENGFARGRGEFAAIARAVGQIKRAERRNFPDD